MAQTRQVPIVRNPDILGGTPVFAGTRVPVRILFGHLEAGDNLDRFLDQFPSVEHEQAVEVLAYVRNQLLDEEPRGWSSMRTYRAT